MKKLALFTLLFFIFLQAKAQDSIRPFEFGATVVTMNSSSTRYYGAADRPAFEFINTLFFRYTKNRHAFRGLLSYNENSIVYAQPAYVADAVSGNVSHKDFRIGAGIQRTLNKNLKQDWLYGFADVCYRNVYSYGNSSGGITGHNFSTYSTSNGLDTYFGLGFRLRIARYFMISPEMAFNIYSGSENRLVTDLNVYSSNRTNLWSTDVNSILKVHLTARF